MHRTIRSKFTRCLLSFCVAFAVGFTLAFTAQPADAAADIGIRWYSTSAIVDIRTTNYRSDISGAVYGWSNSSDLTVTEAAAPSGFGGIIVFQGNYGATNWDGFAQPYNQHNQSCATWPGGGFSGNCNTSDKKAHYGYIYFNDYYGSYWMPKYGARHELGHFWGLGHLSNCATDNSVMENGGCRPNVPEYLQSDELGAVNSWY